MSAESKKSLGQAIDAIIEALKGLDESTKIVAVKAACEHLNLPMDGIVSAKIPPVQETDAKPQRDYKTPQPDSTTTDIRSFKDAKQPRTAIEMACIVAYYLENQAKDDEQKKEISTDDIVKYFKQAPFKLPKVPTQLLISARAAGYFDSAGHGKYKLNPVGYNLVAHSLPRTSHRKS